MRGRVIKYKDNNESGSKVTSATSGEAWIKCQTYPFSSSFLLSARASPRDRPITKRLGKLWEHYILRGVKLKEEHYYYMAYFTTKYIPKYDQGPVHHSEELYFL